MLRQIEQGEKLYFAENQHYINITATANLTDVFGISVHQGVSTDWDFNVVTPDEYNFTATAIREKGPCANKRISFNQNGTLDDSDWMSCANNL